MGGQVSIGFGYCLRHLGSPLHVVMQALAEARIGRKLGGIGGFHECRDEALPLLFCDGFTRVATEDSTVAAVSLGVGGRPTENLAEPGGEVDHVFRVASGAEHLVEHRIGEAYPVVLGGEPVPGWRAAGEFVDADLLGHPVSLITFRSICYFALGERGVSLGCDSDGLEG